SLAQSSLTGDFNKYSAMTIVDRQNLEKTLAEQAQSLSGIYSEADYVKIGELTNARLIASGAVTKTASGYMLELSVTDVESGERRASFPPQAVSAEALENLSAVKEASAELLGQLGVKLTGEGLAELKKAAAPNTVQAEAALAKGIGAQRQGTEVAALSYYFQAASLDPSLLEAASRSSIISANISSGNIREDALNDIQWRREWLARLTETEEFFEESFKDTASFFTLFYSTEIRKGAIDYENETMSFNVNVKLHISQLWETSLDHILQTVFTGLNDTGRWSAWGLSDWPLQSVSSLNPFDTKYYIFSMTMDLINDKNMVIGSESFSIYGGWGWRRRGILPEMDIIVRNKTLNIAGIKIDDITNNLTLRISNISRYNTQAEPGNLILEDFSQNINSLSNDQADVLRIRAITGDEWRYNNSMRLEKCVITSYRAAYGENNIIIIINNTIWDDPVIAIGYKAFSDARLASVTLPTSLKTIGTIAFAKNDLTSIIIPSSVTSIGHGAFQDNKLSRISIPGSETTIWHYAFGSSKTKIIEENVDIDYYNNSGYKGKRGYSLSIFGTIYYTEEYEGSFSRFYERTGKRAGTYELSRTGWRFLNN
ncbi:MAG: leucine-rich repeat domain-containing protein, partial [Treponema sp.]|nr:leucine-rich repeat domain-containing protein [Treponema sp.]